MCISFKVSKLEMNFSISTHIFNLILKFYQFLRDQRHFLENGFFSKNFINNSSLFLQHIVVESLNKERQGFSSQ